MQAEILEGEAPESDEDEEQEQKVETTKHQQVVASNVVVSGEASETDEEDDEEGEENNEKTSPRRSVEHKWLDAKSKKSPKKFKYDSPFHKKLRERNLQLRTDIVENVVNMYHSAHLKLDGSMYHLNKAQSSVQDVSHNVHNLLEDLKLTQTKLENILTAEFLPSFTAHLNEVLKTNKKPELKTSIPEAVVAEG